jgi:Tfp pilus assembly protein PilF
MRKRSWSIAAALALAASHSAAAPNFCGELTNPFGPFDPRLGNIDNRMGIVLNAHFPPHVENLERGNRGTLGADLDYTLRALPNYTRALVAMGRLGEKLHTVQAPGAHYPVECYFDRAIRFAPDDASVRVAYGNFLFVKGRNKEALAMFEAAQRLEPDSATINYNLGLAYFRDKQYDKANLCAHRAYAAGFPLPGLRHMLTGAGAWKDVADDAPRAPAPAADTPADTPADMPAEAPAPVPGTAHPASPAADGTP